MEIALYELNEWRYLRPLHVRANNPVRTANNEPD